MCVKEMRGYVCETQVYYKLHTRISLVMPVKKVCNFLRAFPLLLLYSPESRLHQVHPAVSVEILYFHSILSAYDLELHVRLLLFNLIRFHFTIPLSMTYLSSARGISMSRNSGMSPVYNSIVFTCSFFYRSIFNVRLNFSSILPFLYFSNHNVIMV